jgi:hypothetical protein
VGSETAWIPALAGAALLACATPAEQAPEAAPAATAQEVAAGEAAPGPGGGGRVAGGFPTPEELEKLGQAPVPGDLFALDVRPVDSWRLVGPFPERVEATPYSEDTPWAALLDDAASRRAGLVVPTRAMYCVARELGRFYLAHGGQPDDALRRFITSRCNASVARVGFGFVGGPVSRRQDDVQIYGHWRDSAIEAIARNVVGGPRTIGIWYGREVDRAVVMIAFGYREVHVEPFSPVPGPDGKIAIRGEALAPVANVTALVNRGRYGFAPCEREPGVSPPRFHFACEPDPADRSARIAVSYAPPDRLLARGALGVLAWPQGETEEEYRLPSYVKPHPILDRDALAPDFVELLNGVRRDAGLPPLVLDREQSLAADELAPHFFASLLGHSPPMYAELVILGMIAGWGVEGIVQSGYFTAAWVMRTSDLGRLLASALEEPMGREALLAADIDRIAVGALLDVSKGHESMAAVFGTYSLFSAREHERYAASVYERLEAQRAERGLRPPVRLDDVAPLCDQAAGRVAAGTDPRDALRELLRGSSETLRRPVSGWIAEVGAIDELEFPAEYVGDDELNVAVAVAHRQEEGEPWGRYVVMLVVADPAGRGT